MIIVEFYSILVCDIFRFFKLLQLYLFSWIFSLKLRVDRMKSVLCEGVSQAWTTLLVENFPLMSVIRLIMLKLNWSFAINMCVLNLLSMVFLDNSPIFSLLCDSNNFYSSNYFCVFPPKCTDFDEIYFWRHYTMISHWGWSRDRFFPWHYLTFEMLLELWLLHASSYRALFPVKFSTLIELYFKMGFFYCNVLVHHSKPEHLVRSHCYFDRFFRLFFFDSLSLQNCSFYAPLSIAPRRA